MGQVVGAATDLACTLLLIKLAFVICQHLVDVGVVDAAGKLLLISH